MTHRGAAAIVGAGLGGLTAALALMRSGWRVRVFEQASQLGEAGAGISLASGAGRTLASLGIGPALLAHSMPVPDVAFADYRTGALLAGSLDDGMPIDRGFETARHIHRADLHAILLDAVRAADPAAVLTSKRLVSVEEVAGQVIARFANGSMAMANILVAADGVRSIVRQQLFGSGDPEFAGQVAYRCLVPGHAAAPYMRGGNAVVSIGAGRMFHRYTLRRGQLVNVIGIVRSSHWSEEGWNTPATVDEFAAAYEGFHADVIGLIRQAPAEQLIKWGLVVRPPLRSWSQGRIVLIGDAAHPILPFLGLGAALALEDGVVLARCLERFADVERAFMAFQATRHGRVDLVRTQTMLQGNIIQAAEARVAEVRRSPSQDPRLFDYDATTVPAPCRPLTPTTSRGAMSRPSWRASIDS